MINSKIKVQIVVCVCLCVLIYQCSQDEQSEGLSWGRGGVWGREVMAPSCGQSWLLLPRVLKGETLVVME